MEKIFNNPKFNIYGGIGMKNKYIFMKRKFNEYIEYFIYKIDEITNEKFPIKYSSDRSYKLIVYNDYNKKMYLKEHLNEIELTNWDELYEISVQEFIVMFKQFIEYDDKLGKYFSDIIFKQ